MNRLSELQDDGNYSSAGAVTAQQRINEIPGRLLRAPGKMLRAMAKPTSPVAFADRNKSVNLASARPEQIDRKEIPFLKGLSVGKAVPSPTEPNGAALSGRTLSQTPVNKGNQPWSQVDNSRLDTRDSSVKSIMRNTGKDGQLESVDITPWTTEEQARFNRPVGEYRKVNRPGLIRRGSANNSRDSYGADFSMGQDSQAMPDFSRGNSKANKAVQRSNEAKWLMDRGKGADARGLANLQGGQNIAERNLQNMGAADVANIRADSASNLANIGVESDRQRNFLAQQSLANKNKQDAQERYLSQEDQMSDWYESQYAMNSPTSMNQNNYMDAARTQRIPRDLMAYRDRYNATVSRLGQPSKEMQAQLRIMKDPAMWAEYIKRDAAGQERIINNAMNLNRAK